MSETGIGLTVLIGRTRVLRSLISKPRYGSFFTQEMTDVEIRRVAGKVE